MGFPVTFASLGLCKPLLRALVDLGHDEPTPVQASVIPAVLRGADVWASAKTGSGKTAAFVLPILELQARTLIVVPTRELAIQIGEAIASYGRHLPRPPKTCVVIGGVSINPQMMSLRGGAGIVVATPGRLLDLVDHNALQLSSIAVLVLDEADRLFSLGFADELTRLRALLPSRRQNLLFSATFPPAVRALADEILHDPTRFNLDAGATPDGATIVQRAIEVDVERRTMLLCHLFKTHGWSHLLVFVATKHTADTVAGKLVRAGISAAPLHGDLSQGARTAALAGFKAKRLQVLVATDLAARGLDIVNLPAVVNYDLPRSAVDYLHRIGRTGRAGETGMAVSFISPATHSHFRLIEKRHRFHVEREHVAGFEPSTLALPPRLARPAADPHGGVKGKRKSKKDKLREAAARAQKPC